MARPDESEVGDPLAPRGLETDAERTAAVAPAVESLRRRLLALRDALPSSAGPPPTGVEP